MSDSDSLPELVPFESDASSDSESSSDGPPALDKRALAEKKRFESDKKGTRGPDDPHANVAPAYSSSSSFPQGGGMVGGRDLAVGIGGMPDPNQMTAGQLKRFCVSKLIDYKGCLEKSDFQKVVHAWISEEFARMASNGASLVCGLSLSLLLRARACVCVCVCTLCVWAGPHPPTTPPLWTRHIVCASHAPLGRPPPRISTQVDRAFTFSRPLFGRAHRVEVV